MKDRIKRIVSQVRLNLKEVGTDVIQNREIYNRSDYIQEEIMRECKCNEIDFKIYTIAGQEEYDINLENANLIKTHETSWGGKLIYVNNILWNEYSDTGSNYPAYFNLYAKKLRLRPVPLITNDTITIWAYQDSLTLGMDDDIEPEIPSYADRCLIYGICAEFDEKFIDNYEAAKNYVAINAHSSISTAKEGGLNW